MKKTLNTSYFSDDLWIQIFPYFQLHLIFKFRCISKVWNFHLSCPKFIHKWIQFNSNTLSPWMLIYIFKQNSFRKFSIAYPDSHSQFISRCRNGFCFEFLNSNSTLYFLGSSNGLVLCSRDTIHYVCNPVTQKWVILPPPPPQFDTERLSTLTGFMCDCFSEHTSYKVVRVPPWQQESNKFGIQVFSSDLGKWNLYEVFCPDGVTVRFPRDVSDGLPGDGVTIHGNVLYWIDMYDRIVACNIENDESHVRQCRLIDLPGKSDRGIVSSTRCLGESDGSIFYARINRRQETLCVWVRQEDNFHLLHNDIDLHDLFGEIDIKLFEDFDGLRWGHDLVEVLGFSPVDSNVVIIGYKNCVWGYNIGTRKYDELCHPSIMGNKHSASDTVYLPLLVKPMPTILPPRSW